MTRLGGCPGCSLRGFALSREEPARSLQRRVLESAEKAAKQGTGLCRKKSQKAQKGNRSVLCRVPFFCHEYFCRRVPAPLCAFVPLCEKLPCPAPVCAPSQAVAQAVLGPLWRRGDETRGGWVFAPRSPYVASTGPGDLPLPVPTKPDQPGGQGRETDDRKIDDRNIRKRKPGPVSIFLPQIFLSSSPHPLCAFVPLCEKLPRPFRVFRGKKTGPLRAFA